MIHQMIKKYRPRGYARLLKLLSKINSRYRYVLVEVNGFEVELDLSLNSDIGMYMNRCIPNEKGLETILKAIVTSSDVFYDIGSNQGYYVFLMAPVVSKVYGFEPNLLLYNRLVRTVAKNSFANKISIFNCGVGSTDSKLKFHHNLSDHTLGNFRSKPADEGYLVEVRSLDAIVTEDLNPPTIIKIDVEGFELHVLKGAMRTIAQFTPLIFLEWSDSFAREVGFVFSDLISMFNSKDWVILRIENNGILRSSEVSIAKTTNDLLIVNVNDVRYPELRKLIA